MLWSETYTKLTSSLVYFGPLDSENMSGKLLMIFFYPPYLLYLSQKRISHIFRTNCFPGLQGWMLDCKREGCRRQKTQMCFFVNFFYSTMMTLIALEKPNFYYHYHRKLSWRIRNSQTNTLDALILDSNFSVLWIFLSIDNHSPHNTTTESSSGADKGCLGRLTEGRNRAFFS